MGRKWTGITFRNGIAHFDAQYLGMRIRGSAKTSDGAEAAELLALKKQEIREAKLKGIRPRRTFEQGAVEYLARKADKRSLETDIIHLEQLMPYIGKCWLDQVHMGLVPLQQFIADRKAKGRKTKSINLALGVLRHLLNAAAGEWIDEHGLTWLLSAPKIKMLKVKDATLPYPLSFVEQRKLFKLLPEYLHDMALFKVNTGTREQEVCGLRWEYEQKVPELHTNVFVLPGDKVKNELPRVIVLNSIARSIIDKWRGRNLEHVFVYEGHRLHRMNNRAWRKARKEAGIEVRVHDLKHTWGARLRAAGVSEHDQKDLLGHVTNKSRDITYHYTAGQIGKLIEAAEKVTSLGVDTPNLKILRVRIGSGISSTGPHKTPAVSKKLANG